MVEQIQDGDLRPVQTQAQRVMMSLAHATQQRSRSLTRSPLATRDSGWVSWMMERR